MQAHEFRRRYDAAIVAAYRQAYQTADPRQRAALLVYGAALWRDRGAILRAQEAFQR